MYHPPGHFYEPLLVAASILLACTGSYVALTLAAQVDSVTPRLRLWWRSLTAVTAGLTLWVMHFVGLLACHFPVPVRYDPGWTLLSLLVAEVAALITMTTLIRHQFSRSSLIGGGVLFGLGVAAMHYSGMLGLRGPMTLNYSGPWVLLSVLVAVSAATAGLVLLRWDRYPQGLSWTRLVSATLVGLAISSMHYVGMRAVTFTLQPGVTPAGAAGPSTGLAAAVIAAAALIFVLLLATFQVGRHFIRQGQLRDEMRERADLGEQRYWTVFNNLTEGVLIIDSSGELLSYNESARRILDLPGSPEGDRTAARALAREHFRDEHGQHVPFQELPGNRSIRTGVPVTDVKLGLHLPGQPPRWLSMSAQPLPAQTGALPGAVISFSDVTVERRYAQRLLEQAHQDELTKLPNRRQFHQALSDAMQHADQSDGRVALLYFDLDHFKNVNDTLGHSVGDEVLREIACRLHTALPAGFPPARFGGDEFAAIVPHTEHADVQRLIDAMQAEVARPITVEGRELYTGFSAGFSVYPDDGQDVTTLLKHADLALNHVKSSGRGGSLRYTPALAERRIREVEIERALRHAIGTDQFTLAYQPIYDLRRARIQKCEALLRWTHPALGFVSPAEFIPVAEESGLIAPLGEWVLREACRQGQAWRAAGHPLPIAVNISMRQFSSGALPDLISRALTDHDLSGPDLIVEVTESTLMNGRDDVAGQLSRIRQAGTRVALDDFGTGFSSLQLLHELPIDELKLDRSFIQDMANSSRQHLLVCNIVTLAHGLGLSVTAEGIETLTQRQDLITFKCELGQGYLMSRPLSPSAMTDLLSSAAPSPARA